MNFINLARAEQLLQQGRYDLAETELRKYLASNVEDAEAHAYLGLCLLNLKKNKDAIDEIHQSIALNPDFSFSHYLLSKLYIDEDNYKKAEEAIKEAIRLDSSEAEYFETLSIIYFNQSKYSLSLEIADRGLEANPEHVGCLNIRARNLIKLDRKEFGNDTFTASFNKDPDNAYTHANQGWAFLEQRNYKGALEHFREALRLDPTNDFAKAGLVEALKAKYLIYKWFLQFMFWADGLSSGARWGMLIGIVIVNRYVHVLANAYLGFVLFTWFLDIIFNSLLRLNKYGKHALSREQVLASNIFLSILSVAAISITLSYTLGIPGMISIAIVCLGMLFPTAGTFRQHSKRNKKKSLWFTYALSALGLAFIAVDFLLPESGESLMSAFIIGVVAYTWFVNTLK